MRKSWSDEHEGAKESFPEERHEGLHGSPDFSSFWSPAGNSSFCQSLRREAVLQTVTCLATRERVVTAKEIGRKNSFSIPAVSLTGLTTMSDANIKDHLTLGPNNSIAVSPVNPFFFLGSEVK